MTRSRRRKLARVQARTAARFLIKATPVASALLAWMPAVHAQEHVAENAALEEITVTAQKRTENLQDVPLSIQALGTSKLEELHITNFDDYAKYLPSVEFLSTGPGFEHVYMRGVSSSVLENHSGSLPTVGVYLDEQPVTTIDGILDIHIYDIARVESLSGPQGTLYGASSEAGTIRIITNKPDPTAFAAGYQLGVNDVDHGSIGYSIEGFLNVPLTPIAAIRLVAWEERKAGFIDVVPKAYTFPTSGITFSDAPFVKGDANYVDTQGGRMALKVDLNDSWSITPTVMGQVTSTGQGPFAYNPAAGDLNTWQFFSDATHDSWMQSALTVEGKISDFDIVYSGGYLARNTHEFEDYTDYSLFYDRAYGSGASFVDSAGKLINPAQDIQGHDHFTKTSNEFRVTSPKQYRFRFTAGAFLQRQVHEIFQNYVVNNGGDPLGSVPPNDVSLPGHPGTLWLTDQERVDRDSAVFGEASFDLTDHLTALVGDRHYHYDNTLFGFYGFSSNYSSHTGVAICRTPFTAFHGAPCVDLDKGTAGSGNSPKLNLTYKFDADHLVYATLSKGFRPGGVNRNGGGLIPPYKPDYLTNYELGWKTTWDNHRLRFNGAFFVENWKDFQFSYLGPNALTIITNASTARIKGLETDLEFAATEGLTLSGGFSLIDAKLTRDFCGDPTLCTTAGYEQFAPEGTRLPVTPKFKGDLTARYTIALAGGYQATVQAAAVYVGSRSADLRTVASNAFGAMPSYTLTDFTAEVAKGGLTGQLYVSNAFDNRAILNRFSECDVSKCGNIAIYDLPAPPRTIGLKVSQKF